MLIIVIYKSLGKVTLTKRKVVIDVTARKCLKCDHNCIHYEAFEHCSDTEYLKICQPTYLKKYKFFFNFFVNDTKFYLQWGNWAGIY